ncbi:MAG: PH domain-containing protein, partial [Pirellulales bacterium]|nr:PH domain-containing protein [Pirellulales bacterium]
MKCKQCGTEVPEGAAFCSACGAALTAAMAPASPKQRLAPKPLANADPEDPEEVLWEGRFSKLAMLGSWLSAGAFTLAAIVLGFFLDFDGTKWTWAIIAITAVWLGLILWLLYQQFSIRYSMTSQRLIHEHGLLWRRTDRIEAIDIDDVSVTQGPIARMVGVGNIKIVSSDQSTPLFYLQGIDDARAVATMIDEVRRKERRKRGVHIESV